MKPQRTPRGTRNLVWYATGRFLVQLGVLRVLVVNLKLRRFALEAVAAQEEAHAYAERLAGVVKERLGL